MHIYVYKLNTYTYNTCVTVHIYITVPWIISMTFVDPQNS